MPIGTTINFPLKIVNRKTIETCVAMSNLDDLERNDLLESMLILLKYIKKTNKNKSKNMPNITPTLHVQKLVEALQKRGVDLKIEHWDGHKHVDIYIPKDNLYIEVDGMHHITRPETIISDLNRDYFSFKGGFFTKHITNEAIDTHLEQIADAIAHVAHNAPNKIGENL